jgi:hypothetical protein
MYLFSISTQYNLTSCPIWAPYVSLDQKSCVNCNGIFNIGQKTCYNCSIGTHYNSTSSKC